MKNVSSVFEHLIFPLSEEQKSILKQLIVSLSAEQIIWISGYLYGLIINSNTKFQSFNIPTVSNYQDASSMPVAHTITILSASQTGNARQLAKKLYQSLIEEKFNVRLINTFDYNVKKISQEKLLFLVISTFGEGEPPEEAVTLYKYLFSRNAPSLQGVSYSVFGLGDRTYENFSKAAKDFDIRLEELGANRIYHRVDADLDYQKQAVDWRGKIITLLKNQFMMFNVNHVVNGDCRSRVGDNVITNFNSVIHSKYTRDAPFSACLLVRQKITSRTAFKDVYHLEIDLSGSGMSYQPGDSLGVWYENDPELVTELLRYCDFTGREEVNVRGELLPCSIVFQKYYDLTNNSSLIAKKYASLTDNSELLSSFVDDFELKKFVSLHSIIDMVRCWPPLKLFPEQLLSILRPLSPRFYSISSAQREVGEEVHITVGAVRYEIDGHVRSGGASGYLLDRLSEGDKLQIFIVPNESFRLPQDGSTSIIMIAAGTGIAPFRAFMQQRFSNSEVGENWLFFGNLCFIDDFLYQREWQRYFKDGVLTRINTAWSRDQENKIYVQDKIFQNGCAIWEWIKNGAYVYICGDAARMAHCVEESLIQLIVKYGKMSLDESNLFLSEMRMLHRYQKDVY